MTADQLRKSILQQAIQGKLVPQDPNDEPASVLLERIREEKARLVEEKKIKKEKNPSVIFKGEDNSYYEKFTLSGEVKCIDEEIPFEIPNGWEWCRLGSIVDFSTNLSVRSNIIPPDAWLLDLEDIEKETGKVLQKKRYVDVISKSDKHKFFTNNILYSKLRPYLNKVVLADEEGFCTSEILVFDFKLIYNKYALWYLRSPFFVEYAMKDAYGVKMPRLGSNQGNMSLFPLPSLAEQQRIVNKLEELIPHIDLYGKAQTELDTLNKNIKEQLKKSVLQYAIEGKLVPQDKAEGTAEELLLQIQAEKQKLYEENKLKKKDLEHSTIFKGEDNKYYEKIGKNVTEIESDYSFPNSWAIARLSAICILTDGEKKEGQNICLDAKFLRGKTEGDYLQKGRFVQKGDNIILVDGENSGEVFTIPRNGYMGSTFKKLWVNPVMDLQYVLYFIQFYKDLLRNSKKGAAIPHLNKELFYSLLIGIPPLSEQQRIVNTIQNIFRCIEKN